MKFNLLIALIVALSLGYVVGSLVDFVLAVLDERRFNNMAEKAMAERAERERDGGAA